MEGRYLNSYSLGALKFPSMLLTRYQLISSAVDVIKDGSRRYHVASKIEDFGRCAIEYQRKNYVKVHLAYLIHDAASRVF